MIRGIVINTILFVILTYIFSSTGLFYVSSFGVALLASIVLAILNVLVRPVLWLLSLPINILTLGLFSIILNAVMLQLTSAVVSNQRFYFSSFGASLLIAILMSICNAVISGLFVD
ncbi:MAG: phage holin family protein [[Lactobacillus] timonensis]|jgi:putative membrane protein|uniref:phage holin family protein n=1 Tax=[Lactobacillus] timonensis TaxID=1970790 RepID=UPI002354F93E|nr:phage holin family protein [[Lactobacillus] timonensis]MCI1287339.1 phage holin family protein [[Lactobacillus] timonensis]MCI1926226.1 phage holin family protein [[Lactobacillus] timonensis]MCI1957575.1 phage holin family protein [[Lactobacillus] timonensis]MCI1970623.1 phage holin family protein [[Lactobacillus] timonensis]MCI2006781.1 phage holin family protein [[Lactobacillus] timonensis]